MDLGTFILVHAAGLVPPVVVLKETYGEARSLGHAAKIFFALPEIGRMGSLACVFVVSAIAVDLGVRLSGVSH